jgi:cytochrome c556
MKVKRIIFAALLLILMVGAVSASDNMTDDTVGWMKSMMTI